MSNCALFSQFTLLSALRLWQLKYCEAEYQRCERFRAVEAGRTIPANLLPNGTLLKLRVPKP